MLEVGVGRVPPTRPSRSRPPARSAIASRCAAPGPDRRAQVRRGHERRVEVGLLGEQPDATGRACATTAPRSGSSRPAASRSSVVLPAPLGPTRPIRSPSAMAAVDRVEDHERADLAGDAREAQDRHQPPPADRRPGRRPAGRRRPLRPLGPGPGRRARRLVRRQPEAPLPGASSVQRRPRRTSPPVIVAQDRARRPCGRPPGSRWHHEQNASTARR